jgi:DNA-binding CsgD family transcriptional regulator
LVEDLGSLNHTSLNGQEVKSGKAELNDEIQFGAVRCRLSSSPIGTPESEESMSTAQVLPGNTLDISGLTPAQQEVLGLAIQGLDDNEIARRTGRKPGTVHSHVKVIYDYFGVHTRAQLMAKARQA